MEQSLAWEAHCDLGGKKFVIHVPECSLPSSQESDNELYPESVESSRQPQALLL
jgi:hypothetical protein